VATDYRASVSRLSPRLEKALELKVAESDRALALTVLPGHSVVVFGYAGDQFIRIDAGGVAVNAASPTAGSARLLKRAYRRTAGRPAWLQSSSGRTIVWHDARVQSLPHGVDRARWSIPLVVDGRRARLSGSVRRVPAPSPWPWLALAIAFAAAAFLIRGRRGFVTGLLGLFAGTGTVVVELAFALASGTSQGRWVEAGNEVLFALVGLAVLARGSPDAQAIASGALGLLALLAGLAKLPALLHGVVLSALPATIIRAAVALTICSGVAATAVGLVVFFELLERDENDVLSTSV
jgi:hypothetical protein